MMMTESMATLTKSDIEVVATFTETRPGNVAISSDGRIFISMQPLDNPTYRVIELLPNGVHTPFPNEGLSRGSEIKEGGLAAVIGINCDDQGGVWILDMGSEQSPPQILAWDSSSNALRKQWLITANALASNSFLQDFVIDTRHNQIYIADTSLGNLVGSPAPAIVVLDLNTGECRRVLERHKYLLSPEYDLYIGNNLMATKRDDGTIDPVYLGINPIAIDKECQYVYFGSVNGDKIFRIATEVLADSDASKAVLSDAIEVYGDKRPSDGMVMDNQNRIYVGDLEKNGVGISDSQGYRLFAQDDTLLSWADGFAIHDGYLYVTQNSLHLHPIMHSGVEGATKPYHLVRIKLA